MNASVSAIGSMRFAMLRWEAISFSSVLMFFAVFMSASLLVFVTFSVTSLLYAGALISYMFLVLSAGMKTLLYSCLVS